MQENITIRSIKELSPAEASQIYKINDAIDVREIGNSAWNSRIEKLVGNRLDGNQAILLAELGGEIVGYMLYDIEHKAQEYEERGRKEHHHRTCLSIEKGAVLSGYLRRGINSAMHKRAETELLRFYFANPPPTGAFDRNKDNGGRVFLYANHVVVGDASRKLNKKFGYELLDNEEGDETRAHKDFFDCDEWYKEFIINEDAIRQAAAADPALGAKADDLIEFLKNKRDSNNKALAAYRLAHAKATSRD